MGELMLFPMGMITPSDVVCAPEGSGQVIPTPKKIDLIEYCLLPPLENIAGILRLHNKWVTNCKIWVLALFKVFE